MSENKGERSLKASKRGDKRKISNKKTNKQSTTKVDFILQLLHSLASSGFSLLRNLSHKDCQPTTHPPPCLPANAEIISSWFSSPSVSCFGEGGIGRGRGGVGRRERRGRGEGGRGRKSSSSSCILIPASVPLAVLFKYEVKEDETQVDGAKGVGKGRERK